MSAATEIVDLALDAYVESRKKRGGIEVTGVRAKTLAYIAGISVREMSAYLQSYRREGGGRYVIASEGYGRDAPWKILAKPNGDPKVLQKFRVRHAHWVADDAAQRVSRDIAFELEPALRNTGWDQVIEAEAAAMRDAMTLMVRRMERAMAKLNGDS